MSEAKTLDLKKLLMRYRRLKNEANLRDPAFVDRLSKNYFSCVRKSGVLQKRGETSWFGSWENRYVILTNAGLLYFEGKMIQSKGDLKPQNFKPLNDFVVRTCNPKDFGDRKFVFQLIFHKDSLMKYDLTLEAPTDHDRQEWVRSLRMHQCDLFRSRATILEGWLDR